MRTTRARRGSPPRSTVSARIRHDRARWALLPLPCSPLVAVARGGPARHSEDWGAGRSFLAVAGDADLPAARGHRAAFRLPLLNATKLEGQGARTRSASRRLEGAGVGP
ncbi:hypothetical protein C2845_PM10G02570 [Panicum miliaceum]|uniref:Uncharacterized protein n=1 Tax=Panicum miliaceum TaxID=4540 RepID=A0A3L6PAJ2_PANMI|nr:hypothetical protein C2845_PM10G02570 [Panicum miliaceum]